MTLNQIRNNIEMAIEHLPTEMISTERQDAIADRISNLADYYSLTADDIRKLRQEYLRS